MEEYFGVVIFGVVIVGAVVALITFIGTSALYDQIGRGGLNDEREIRPAPAERPVTATTAEQEAEIRQLLEAKNDRRARRGQDPLDVDDEVRRLTRTEADPALRAEVRELVLARNERRVRRGQEPLDVEAEIERQLAELG